MYYGGFYLKFEISSMSILIIKYLFRNLIGKWNSTKVIYKQGQKYDFFTGEVNFSELAPNLLISQERGYTILNNKKIKSGRKYIYEYNLDKDKFSVFFTNYTSKANLLYELTHQIDHSNTYCSDGTLKFQGLHLCGLDKYFVTYTFKNKNELEISHKIIGPNKHIVLKSILYKK